MFSLNPQSGIPIYRQLMEQARRMIAGGQLKPGDELPSVREVALTHAVNPMTISKAYSLLEAEGLLERRRGVGMRVAAGEAQSESRKDRLQRLRPALDQLAMAASQLGLDADDVIGALRETLEKNSAEKPHERTRTRVRRQRAMGTDNKNRQTKEIQHVQKPAEYHRLTR